MDFAATLLKRGIAEVTDKRYTKFWKLGRKWCSSSRSRRVLPSMTYFDALLMWQASYFLCNESLELTKNKVSMHILVTHFK